MNTLDTMIRSNEFLMWHSDLTGNSMYLDDPDRKDRIEAAAENSEDGSTHAEVIQDWRDFLDQSNYSRSEKFIIGKAIDRCEKRHEKAGTLNEQVD